MRPKFNAYFEYDAEASTAICGFSEAPRFAGGGVWRRTEWWWNTCEYTAEGTLHRTHVMAQGLEAPLGFTGIEPYGSQTAEYVIRSTAGSALSESALRTLVEGYLEKGGLFGGTVNWGVGGEGGPPPVPKTATSAEEEEGTDGAGLHGGGGCKTGGSVNCASGNETVSETDIAVGGRGPGLAATRTYNSQAAARATSHGVFGYGWDGPYSAHTSEDTETGIRTVYTSSGTATRFQQQGEHWVADSPRVQATLNQEGSAFLFTLPDRTTLRFDSEGNLASETDRNGNAVTVHRGGGRIESVSDSAGRSLKYAYNSEGLVESITDPMGHVVKYAYESGNLTSVTEPGATAPRHRFKYNSSHDLTEETDGRGNTLERTYDGSSRVTSETDALHRKRTWEYSASFGTEGEITTITEPNAAVTREEFDLNGEPTTVAHAYGTPLATTVRNVYSPEGLLITSFNGRGMPSNYTYDTAGNRTTETDALDDETKWTFDSTHDVLTTTTPSGETSTIKRDSHGNAESVSRPAPGETTQSTKYSYDSHGDVESMTDPLGHTWKYEYDSYGDRVAETDPEGDKRTWSYNEDSQQTSTVSPRGNVEGVEASRYTTSFALDAQGRPTAVTEPEANAPGKPTNTAPAAISGTTQEHQTLSASTGIWRAAPPVSYTYQWQRCNSSGGGCSSIGGATGSKHVLVAADVSHTIRAQVTASNTAGSASSTTAATTVIAAYIPVYAYSFGSSGSGSGQFSHPFGEALDAHGNVWVADGYNSRIEKFSSSGTWLATYGKGGTGNGEFAEPVGIAINQTTGNVYIGDQNNNRVQELNEKGEWVRNITGGEGSFKEPDGIAIDSSGNVWVTDYGNNRIEKFSETGSFILKAGSSGSGEGQFSGPDEIALAAGKVYVTDNNNARVEIFGEEGKYASQFGAYGTTSGDFRYPAGITTGPNGNLYVADSGNNRIQEFTPEGSFIEAFGTTGSGPGQFSEPEYITFNPAGEMYISDTANNRIQLWKPNGAPAATTAPTVSGQLQKGQTLTASTGTWTGNPTPSYTYRWQRCNSTGGECTNITGANAATYNLAPADYARTLRVVVTATNSAGAASSTSTATEAIPRPRVVEYAYDPNGNVESLTDANGQTTHYTYDADNEQTKVEAPDAAITETGYDAAGQITSQTDGSKQTTTYTRDKLERVTEATDPLGRKTTSEYDAAGNLTKTTDPAKRTTTYTYNPLNRPSEVTYSDGKTHSVQYAYDRDGHRTRMTDGTGDTTYAYDPLGRLVETTNGHGQKSKYEYDLANNQTKITYPNGKAVTRTFDNANRLKQITDWLSNTSKLAYNQDSVLTGITFPSGTSNLDTYSYDEAGQLSEVKMAKGSETLASLGYTRDNDGQLTSTTSHGLPGEETIADEYDPNNRLTKAGSSSYAYDGANDPTKLAGGTYSYDKASQLETGPSLKYTYNEAGQRTTTTPTAGSATTYGYDQAGNLTAVERAASGEIPAIKDNYGYDGNSLRSSQTQSGTSTYLAWDTSKGLPLLLDDGTNSYIYEANSLPIEQINSEGKALYLHHDQQGSTRMLTGTTGKSEATFTYDAYGNTTGTTGTAETPLGYDAQYTSSNTGFIYLRARTYDPKTAQFLSVDPIAANTGAPYFYGANNPVNYIDPSGYEAVPFPVAPEAPVCLTPETIGPCAVVVGGGYVIVEGVKSIVNAWGGEEAGDEGEALLKQRQAEEAAREPCGETPPGYDPETWTKGAASRAKEPGENYYDPEGGEWHYHPPDPWHETPHWDHKPGEPWNAEWEKVFP